MWTQAKNREQGSVGSFLRNKSNLKYLGREPGMWINRDQAGISLSYFSLPSNRLKAISG